MAAKIGGVRWREDMSKRKYVVFTPDAFKGSGRNITHYHDDYLGEFIHLVNFPFTKTYRDGSYSQQAFGDFRILNGMPLELAMDWIERIGHLLQELAVDVQYYWGSKQGNE